MTKIKITIIISFFIINSGVAIAQHLYSTDPPKNRKVEGYVVTLNNDTIYGKIITGIRASMHKKIKFIDSNDQQTVYRAHELKAYHFDNYHFVGNLNFGSKNMPNNRWFLQQLNDGHVEFYRFYNMEVRIIMAGVVIIPYVHTYQYHQIVYGNTEPNNMDGFRRLSLYTKDNREIDSIISVGSVNLNHIPELFHRYNKWLVDTDIIKYYQQKEHELDTITDDIYQAEDKSLLYSKEYDKTPNEYFFRMIRYAQNTLGYSRYIIYDHRDDYRNTVKSGLKILTDNGLKSIGEWKYYYDAADKNSEPVLKKEAYYNANGKLHGEVVKYNKDGSKKERIKYIHGKKIK
ncbi:MAG: hypothetical protein MI922_26445 [Bacteroidales bacterium]|nr:hypothetical protein [Bacteroidales bacterium]